MQQTHVSTITRTMKSWINPPHPGRNKSLTLAVLMGFLLGPLGVALYFRSLAQGGLALVAAMLISLITGWPPEWMGTMVGAIWAVGLILYDNQPPASPKPEMPAPAPMSPMANGCVQPAVAMA